jgi:hypothetical protein
MLPVLIGSGNQSTARKAVLVVFPAFESQKAPEIS